MDEIADSSGINQRRRRALHFSTTWSKPKHSTQAVLRAQRTVCTLVLEARCSIMSCKLLSLRKDSRVSDRRLVGKCPFRSSTPSTYKSAAFLSRKTGLLPRIVAVGTKTHGLGGSQHHVSLPFVSLLLSVLCFLSSQRAFSLRRLLGGLVCCHRQTTGHQSEARKGMQRETAGMPISPSAAAVTRSGAVQTRHRLRLGPAGCSHVRATLFRVAICIRFFV